jgi:hypothetical protein
MSVLTVYRHGFIFSCSEQLPFQSFDTATRLLLLAAA